MNKLPQELHNQIACYVFDLSLASWYWSDSSSSFSLSSSTTNTTEGGWQLGEDELRLAPLSTISRRWQDTVESLLFRGLSILSTDLDDFDRIVVGKRRRHLVELRVQILLPAYDALNQYCEYETDSDRAANNEVATAGLRRLFTVLSTWGADHDLHLRTEFRSPSDDHRPWLGQMGRTRYEYSFIEIQRPALELPEVSCVTTFGTPRWYDPRRRSRNLELCSYLEITRRLPRVSELHWATAEAGLFFLLRREIRDRFVHTAAAADAHDPCRWLPASVKTMAVTIKAPNWSDHQFDHHRRLPNLSRPYGHDEVSAAFRKMSVGLKKFRFKGIADHALFWPSPSEKHIEEPHWPNLTHLRVDLSYQSPSGKWYFKCQDADDPRNHPWSDVPVSGDALEFRPPGYGTEQDKEEALEYLASWLDHVPSFRYRDGRGVFQPTFRTWPNDKVMIPLLESFARAIGQMPSLRSAALLFDDGDLDSYTFVSYASPGYETTATRNAQLRDQKLFKTVPRLVISSCKWRMSKSLKGLFREVGSKCHNQATVVRYLPVSLDYSDDDDDSD